MPVEKRIDAVTRHHLCHNCLSSNHIVRKCGSLFRCRQCAQHHTLLHPTTESREENKAESTIASHTIAAIWRLSAPVLLATARVCISAPDARQTVIGALLDHGSAATQMSENLTRLLHAKRRKCSLRVSGISGGESIARYTTTLIIYSPEDPKTTFTTDALILNALTQYAPERTRCTELWAHTTELQPADPESFSAEPTDLIIGANLYGRILHDGRWIGKPNEPIAQNTVFG